MKKRTLYKIGTTVGVVGVVSSTALAIHHSFKHESQKFGKIPAKTESEKFFDKHVLSSNSSYLSENILSPIDGNSLLEYVTIMDPNHFDGNKNFIKKDNNGNFLSIKEYKVDFKKYKSMESINNKLHELNKEIYKLITSKNLENKQLGLYNYPNPNSRSLIIKIFELNPISDSKMQIVKDFLKDLGEINLKTANESHFFQTFSSNKFLSPGHYTRWYHWTFGIDPDDPDYKNKREQARQKFYDKWNGNKNNDFHNDEGLPILYFTQNKKPWTRKNGQNGQLLNVFKNLWNEGLVVIMTPVPNWENNTFSVSLKFNELDKNSLITDSQDDNVHYVTNSKGVFNVIKEEDLTVLGDQEPLEHNDKNRNIVKKLLTEDIVEYLSKPLVKPGLNLIGQFLPTLSPLLKNIVDIASIFNDDPDKKNIFANPTLLDDPEAEYKGDKLIDKILDLISETPIFKSKTVMEIFETFEDQMDSFWANFDALFNLDESGKYKLYNFTTGFNSFISTLKDAINKVYKTSNKAIKKDDSDKNQNNDDQDPIFGLISELKSKNIIKQSWEITDIVASPYEVLGKIFDYSLKNDFSLSKKYIDIIVMLLHQQKMVNNRFTLDELNNVFTTFLSNPQNFRSIAKLLTVDGQYPAKDVLTKLISDPVAGLKIIAENQNIDPEFILTIGKILSSSKLVPASLNFLIPDTTKSAENVANLFKRKILPQIIDLVQKVQKGDMNFSFSLSQEHINIIASLLHEQKVISDRFSLDELNNLLTELLSNDKNFQSIAKLLTVDGTYPAKDVLTKLISDPVAGLKIIAENKNIDPEFILTIGKILSSSKLVPASLNFLIPDTTKSAENVANLFNSKILPQIIDLVQKVQEDGILSINSNELGIILDGFKTIYPDIFKDINTQNLASIFNTIINDGIINVTKDQLGELQKLATNIVDIDLSTISPTIAENIYSLLSYSIGDYLAKDDAETKITEILNLVSEISPSVKDNPMIQKLPKILSQLGKGFKSEDELINFFKEMFPDFSLSDEVPTIGTIEDIIRQIYSTGIFTIPGIWSDSKYDVPIFSTIWKNGLKSFNKTNMRWTLNSLQAIKKSWVVGSGLWLFLNDYPNIQDILEFILKDFDKTESALLAIITKPIKDIAEEDWKYIAELVNKITGISIDQSLFLQSINLIKSGIPQDKDERQVISKDLGKYLSDSVGIEEISTIINTLLLGNK